MAAIRIGVLGGTFDPPHHGHVALGRLALDAGFVDELRVVVAGDPWQKQDRTDMAGASDRAAMTELAFAALPEAVVDRREIERGGPTYTHDTVVSLRSERPGATIVLIMGTDVASGLDSWHRADEIAAVVEVGVVRRPETSWDRPSPRWRIGGIDGAPPRVSSSDVRRRIAHGEPVDDLISPAVWQFIRTNSLYGFER